MTNENHAIIFNESESETIGNWANAAAMEAKAIVGRLTVDSQDFENRRLFALQLQFKANKLRSMYRKGLSSETPYAAVEEVLQAAWEVEQQRRKSLSE